MLDGRPLDDADLARVLEVKTGSPLTLADVRESIVHVMALARFEDVQVKAEPSGDGVALIFEMAPLRAVKTIEFRGTLGISVKELRAAVVERYGTAPSLSRANEIARVLEGLLHDRGFLKATVSASSEAPKGVARTALVFQVEAGSQARVGSVEVVGAPGGNGQDVRLKLGVQEGARFDRLALEDAISGYLAGLRTRGYLGATMADPEIGYSQDRDRVDVTLRIEHGRRATVEFRGDVPEHRRNDAATLRAQGAVDDDALENEQRAIENELHGQGYRDATARFNREPVGDDVERIVFTVRRGPQYRMGRLDVRGNQQVAIGDLEPILRTGHRPVLRGDQGQGRRGRPCRVLPPTRICECVGGGNRHAHAGRRPGRRRAVRHHRRTSHCDWRARHVRGGDRRFRPPRWPPSWDLERADRSTGPKSTLTATRSPTST